MFIFNPQHPFFYLHLNLALVKKKKRNKNPTTKQNPLVNKILKKKDLHLDLRDGEGSGCGSDFRFWLEKKNMCWNKIWF